MNEQEQLHDTILSSSMAQYIEDIFYQNNTEVSRADILYELTLIRSAGGNVPQNFHLNFVKPAVDRRSRWRS